VVEKMASIIAPAILAVVLLLIFFREKFGQLAPWKVMIGGAFVALLTGTISPSDAFAAVDFGVLVFLYGMFIIATGLEKSGYLQHLGVKFLRRFRNPFFILLAWVIGVGLASALLLNDTVAIIGTPLALSIARKSGIKATSLLVGLALGVTLGSFASPIGNPQNFIIASQPAFTEPFAAFAKYLFIPAIISLVVLTVLLWLFFPDTRMLKQFDDDKKYKGKDYYAARRGLQVVVALSLARLFVQFPLVIIAVGGAFVYIALSGEKKRLLEVDWGTLLFFFGMFVLMEAVWDAGFFQQFLPSQEKLSEPHIVLGASLLLSQVLSNVPFVILYLKALGTMNVKTLVLLAAGSTLAGGLTIFGAASNIIVLQNAEKRSETLPVKEFTVIGVLSTIVSVLLVCAWVALIG
jgi:Na+/H+ antiporter NhaD/arsenite permease-like protein